MTLIGAINEGNKKIIFADRKWDLSNEKIFNKIFVDDKNENYLAVSGFFLKEVIQRFASGENILDILEETYHKKYFPGTSFLHYNLPKDKLKVYFIEKEEVYLTEILNYIFLGVNVKEIEGFDFWDVAHTLIPSIHKHYKKYKDYISNTFDVLLFQNKTPIWTKLKI